MQNKSGISPREYRVLVKPDRVEDVTPGGIIIADETKERKQMAECRGLLVDIGGNAFEDWQDAPKAGDRVLIAKYAGIVTKGDDGEEYRVCSDKDITAVLA